MVKIHEELNKGAKGGQALRESLTGILKLKRRSSEDPTLALQPPLLPACHHLKRSTPLNRAY